MKSTKFRGHGIKTGITASIPNRSDWEKLVIFENAKRSGDVNKIANKAGYSQSYTSRVLRGLRGQNQRIIKAAFGMVKNRPVAKAMMSIS